MTAPHADLPLPPTHDGPPEPFECPECGTTAWVGGWQTQRTCRYCGHTWQTRQVPGPGKPGFPGPGSDLPTPTPGDDHERI